MTNNFFLNISSDACRNDSTTSKTDNDAKEDVIQLTSCDKPEVTNSSPGAITSVPGTTEAELSEDNNSKEKTDTSQETVEKDTTENGIKVRSDPSSNESQTAAAAAAVETASEPSASKMEAAAVEEGGGGVAADGSTSETNVKERLVRKLTGDKFSVTCCVLQ